MKAENWANTMSPMLAKKIQGFTNFRLPRPFSAVSIEVTRAATEKMRPTIISIRESAKVGTETSLGDVFNDSVLDGTAKKLGLSPDKVVVTVDRHANTSAASVPLALDTAVRDGRIKPGQLVMLEAMGGGFTWGASLIRT